SWLMPYAVNRRTDHVPKLWTFFKHILSLNEPEQLSTELMDGCLELKSVGLATLSMGMFWIRPDTWFAADKKNVNSASSLGIADPTNAKTFASWNTDLRARFPDGPCHFSSAADEHPVNEHPVNEHPVNEHPKDSNQNAELSNSERQQNATSVPNDSGRRYWLIAPGEAAYQWEDWAEHNYAAIGWGDVGDMSDSSSKSEIVEKVERNYPRSGKKQVGYMLWHFSKSVRVGDVLFAKQGNHKLCGWGTVSGTYHYDEEFNHDEDEYWDNYPHLLDVEWHANREVSLPEGTQLPTKTFTERKHGSPQLKTLLDAYSEPLPPVPPVIPVDDNDQLFIPQQVVDRIITQLRRKKNIVLQGAPGTGKTFVASRLARQLMAVYDSKRVRTVQFHQSTSYEDFIQGYKPDESGTGFKLFDGAFLRFCKAAAQNPNFEYVYIIDEINRGNLSKVFGELMMLIESDKRGTKHGIPLTYSRTADDEFSVPPNVFLIGTMNTADRSLSIVDYALRRRFVFINVEPAFNTPGFKNTLKERGIPSTLLTHICTVMAALNQQIAAEPNLGNGYCIGHSFFTPGKLVRDAYSWYQDIIEYEIAPLLEEYFYDDLERCHTLIETLHIQ
ncbi:AAA family ATPase, partial [bacterium]|nr:AAA family ATPase [bacterium]